LRSHPAKSTIEAEMPEPILHKYFDFGDRSLANLTLPSGQRVLLTIVPAGFSVHRLHLFGMIPGLCLFGANDLARKQMLGVLARGERLLPPLPKAKKHKDESAMHALLDAAAADLEATAKGKPVPGRVDALDVDNPPERPLSLFTRLALTASDEDELVRLYERTRNTPA
jgi:hypothetical protein